MDIPAAEDLRLLKRPALQKLCKKYGIKANSKNSDMISLLDEVRNEAKKPPSCKEILRIVEPTPESEIQPSTIQSPESSVEHGSSNNSDMIPSLDEVSNETSRPPSCKEVLHVEEPTPESEVQPSTIQSPENRKEDVGIMQCSCKDQEAPVINQEPMQSESSGAEEEQVGNKRKRRSTFEIPPSESLLRPTLSSVRLTPSPFKDHGKMRDEIMAMLDAKVNESLKKVRPNATSGSDSTDAKCSRIPVLKAKTDRFTSHHNKQFKRMMSISDYQERKNSTIRRLQDDLGPSPAKKQKVSGTVKSLKPVNSKPEKSFHFAHASKKSSPYVFTANKSSLRKTCEFGRLPKIAGT